MLSGAAVVLLGLLTVFAIELADTQAKSRRDIEARVHERSVLAAALIETLFGTVQQGVAQAQARLGARTVTGRAIDAYRQQNAFAVLLGSDQGVLASSGGFTEQARAGLQHSAALAILRGGEQYAIGDVAAYGTTNVVDVAVAFPTSYGPRTLVTGFRPAALDAFLLGELRKIPGVPGSHNYVIDGRNTVLASTNPAIPEGARLTTLSELDALRRSSGDRHGHFYDLVGLPHSRWRVVLSAPDGPLFASVSGLRRWVPWLIFIALGVVAVIALVLGLRVVRSAETELRAANRSLEDVNRELAKSNQTLEQRAEELARSNAELEQFASIASHDLQEPLRKVRTFTEQVTATESERLSERGQDYLRRANNAAQRMQTLISDLLEFSRVTTKARPFGPVDLHALKFTREGVAPEVALESSAAGGQVQLVVRDNGIGFESQYGARIFRVFERLHGRSEYPGTGIGLALCRKIAERHGGSIVAEGNPGVGATFTVTLPVNGRGPDPDSSGSVTHGMQPQGGAHVPA